MVPDGYGVCYNPMGDHINFAVTAFNSCEETHATKLTRFLEEALLDMKVLVEQTPKPSKWGGGWDKATSKEDQRGNFSVKEEEEEVFVIPAYVLRQNMNMQELADSHPYLFHQLAMTLIFLPQHFSKAL